MMFDIEELFVFLYTRPCNKDELAQRCMGSTMQANDIIHCLHGLMRT